LRQTKNCAHYSEFDMALPRREDLRQSELVFMGRVSQVGASTMPEVPSSGETVVVGVEEVFQSPDVLRLLAGRSITLVTRNATSLAAGQRLLFLTKVWLYGQSLAVIEVARESGDTDSESLARHVSSEAEAARDAALAARIAAAELVIAGRVVRTTFVDPLDPATISEHSPMWAEAAISVTSVERGSTPGGDVIVAYPESRDVMWYRSAKFNAGDEGIWILHRTRLEGMDRDGLTALDPLDFHPMSALDRIRRIVRGTL
jgi:hypothetical protein